MTIQIRGKSDPVTAADETPTIAVPAGTVDGDLMILVAGRSTAGGSVFDTPLGWYIIPGSAICGAHDVVAFYRVAASEPANYTLNVPDGAGAATYAGIITLYSDTGSGVRFDPGQVANQYNASSGNRVWPSLTFSATGLLLNFATLGGNQSSAPPGGSTEQWDVAGSAPRPYLMTEARSAGATGTRTTTGTATTSKCVSVALIEGALVPFAGPKVRSFTTPNLATVNGSKTVVAPANLAVGDLMLMQVVFTTPDRTPACTGWTMVNSVTGTNSVYVLSKVAVAGDLGATFTVTFAAGSTTCGLGILAWFSPSSLPLAVDHTASSDNASAANRTYAAGVPTVINTGMVGFGNIASANQTTVPDPSYMQERWDHNSGIRMHSWTELLSASGTTGTRLPTGTASASRTVTVVVAESPATVTASFTGTPLAGTAPLTVAFTDASTAAGTTITTRSWTFGDAGTSTATNPSHVYAAAGTYTVALTVGDGAVSDTQTRTAYVVVSAPAVVVGLRPSKSGQERDGLDATNLYVGLRKID